jgi:alginate O-acetyltransferase complex protein AlgJ
LRHVVVDQIKVDLSADFQQCGLGQMRYLPDRGHLSIQGWVIGRNAVPLRVELSNQDGEPIADVAIDQLRPDIAGSFPNAPGSSGCGFTVSLRPKGSGASRVQVTVAFDDGVKKELGSVGCVVAGDEAGSGAVGWSIIDESEKVLFGKQGWLFLHGDTNDILGQHTGKVKMGAARRAAWRRVLEGRVAACERLGIPWHCIVVPDKESVYPEYLPDEVVPSARRPIHELLEVAASAGAPVSYALDRLLAAKQEDELYPRTDTHWNFCGAYVAYQMFCDEVRARGVDVDVLQEEDLEWVEETIEGDLGRKVRPEPMTSSMFLVRFRRPRSRLVFDNEVRNHGRVKCFERDRPGPSCVLFGESYSDYLVPFLQESFQRLVFVHTSMFIADVLEREQPDAVLSLPVERFMIRVPSDVGALAELAATARRKGGGLPWPG